MDVFHRVRGKTTGAELLSASLICKVPFSLLLFIGKLESRELVFSKQLIRIDIEYFYKDLQTIDLHI